MWNYRSIKSLVSVTAVVAGLTGGAAVSAESNYPQRPVTIVVAFAPGGATDVLARKLAQKLGDHYKQSFVVENKPGAGGNIGTAYAGRAKPDGYTLYLGTVASHGVAPNLYKNVGYDPVKDFAPIGLIAASPQIIVVNNNSPLKTIEDLVKHGKSEKSTYASSGAGTTIHLSGEMFNLKADTKMEHVPFSGSGPAVNALLGGHVDVMFDDMPSSAPHVKAGSLRALAVTGKTRSELFPELPTLSEQGKPFGLDGFDVSAWFFLGAPAGIPDTIATSLNQTLNTILAEPDMKSYVAERGAQTLPGTRDDAGKFIGAELGKWNEIITAGNIPKL
jgi:tripartite-type tricarboxylate transporter receptor subunit TctC